MKILKTLGLILLVFAGLLSGCEDKPEDFRRCFENRRSDL